jgi:hypothetical protein
MSNTDDIDMPEATGDYCMMTAEIILDGASESGEAITWRDYDRTQAFPASAHSSPGVARAWIIMSAPLP